MAGNYSHPAKDSSIHSDRSERQHIKPIKTFCKVTVVCVVVFVIGFHNVFFFRSLRLQKETKTSFFVLFCFCKTILWKEFWKLSGVPGVDCMHCLKKMNEHFFSFFKDCAKKQISLTSGALQKQTKLGHFEQYTLSTLYTYFQNVFLSFWMLHFNHVC